MLYKDVFLLNHFAVQNWICLSLCAGGVPPMVWKKKFRCSPPRSRPPVLHLGKDVDLQHQGLKQQPQILQTSCAARQSHCNWLFMSPGREAESGFLVTLHQPIQGSMKVAAKNTEGAPIVAVFLRLKLWLLQIFQASVNYTILEW